jgi:hypothetical protein
MYDGTLNKYIYWSEDTGMCHLKINRKRDGTENTYLRQYYGLSW